MRSRQTKLEKEYATRSSTKDAEAVSRMMNVMGNINDGSTKEINLDGERYYDEKGNFLWMKPIKPDYIKIIDTRVINEIHSKVLKNDLILSKRKFRELQEKRATPIDQTVLKSEVISRIYTSILQEMPDVDINLLHNGHISVSDGTRISNKETGYKWKPAGYNDPSSAHGIANTLRREGTKPWATKGKGYTGKGTGVIKVTIVAYRGKVSSDLNSVSGAQNALGVHEFIGHGVAGFGSKDKSKYDPNGSHYKAYDLQKTHPTWYKAPIGFREDMIKRMKKYEVQRKR